jgi:phage gp29-like protein
MPNAPVLLDHRGNPIRRPELKREIAGPTITGVRSPFTGYPGDGLNPDRLAALLREADEGEPLRYLELAEQIEERDLHYAGVLGTRKRSVTQLPITVDAASDDARDVEIADMVREWLERDELADELFDVLDAVGKGWSATEIIWDTSSGQWRPERLEWRDPRWFRFDRVDGVTPMLRTETGDVPLPGFKFIVNRVRAKSGLPMRSGLARLATWLWLFKAYDLRDWAIFVQTFGQPIRVGKYGAGATEDDKSTLFRAVANIAGDCAAIVPESMMIEFVSAAAPAANVKIYEERADWLDRQVSKAVLGQTATTDAIAGGHAVGQEHRQVQEDIERADCKSLAAILNRDLIRPWVQLEYGPQKRYPRLRIGREEERDVKLTVDAVTRLAPMGMRVSASEMRDLVGLSEPDAGAELLTAPAPSLSGVPPSSPFDGADGDVLEETPDDPALQQQEARSGEAATGKLQEAGRSGAPTGNARTLPEAEQLPRDAGQLARRGTETLIETVRGVLDGASTLEEAHAKIAALELPAGELAMALRQAMVLGELMGRREIVEQTRGEEGGTPDRESNNAG